jgi:hypothetical protein
MVHPVTPCQSRSVITWWQPDSRAGGPIAGGPDRSGGTGPCAAPHWAQLAAEDLVRRFGTDTDRRLWGQMHRIVQGVWARKIDSGPVINAYGQAMGPGILNRGAAFTASIKRCEAVGDARLRGRRRSP